MMLSMREPGMKDTNKNMFVIFTITFCSVKIVPLKIVFIFIG